MSLLIANRQIYFSQLIFMKLTVFLSIKLDYFDKFNPTTFLMLVRNR
jgi:hypothetical protein